VSEPACYVRELLVDPVLADAILARPDVFPTGPPEIDHVIRCSSENVDRAISRALARATVHREMWRLEITRS
jgi:hypothetical protein